MRRVAGIVGVGLLSLLASCGGDDGGSASDNTAEAATEDVTVRVVAQTVGFGCTGTAPIGNDSQLVVLDESGTRLGLGTFQLSPGLTPGVDTCDWTAVAEDVDASHNLYVIEGDGQELATVDLAASDWRVVLDAGVGGIRVVP